MMAKVKRAPGIDTWGLGLSPRCEGWLRWRGGQSSRWGAPLMTQRSEGEIQNGTQIGAGTSKVAWDAKVALTCFLVPGEHLN